MTEQNAWKLVVDYLPYFRGAANRAAPRYGMAAEDLAHEFAVYAFEEALRFDPATCSPRAFVVVRIKRVLGTMFIRRWQRMSGRPGFNPNVLDHRYADPADAAELEDSLDRLSRGLDRLSPRRRQAVSLRFGLEGIGPLAGVELGKALGIRQTTAQELVLNGLRELAAYLGTDPVDAKVSVAEGRSLGARARIERLAAGVGP